MSASECDNTQVRQKRAIDNDEDVEMNFEEIKICQVCKQVESVHCAASSYTEYPSEHMECLNAAPPVTEECREGSDQDEPQENR
ncbi:hypothetical protein OS493_037084 [Desmophyllum pertusum]|uniref:Uncharacterized protein n=1 Tax=Desmophyllum pertusum TaxID=174260 RepID=A0A9X0CVR4_9CNID|nr:hypothetical protein OS493_037084 [Desmophyllum pertusum]